MNDKQGRGRTVNKKTTIDKIYDGYEVVESYQAVKKRNGKNRYINTRNIQSPLMKKFPLPSFEIYKIILSKYLS